MGEGSEVGQKLGPNVNYNVSKVAATRLWPLYNGSGAD